MKQGNKYLKQESVRNRDRMSVVTLLELSDPTFTEWLSTFGSVAHTLVPERLKFTEDNKVGMYTQLL